VYSGHPAIPVRERTNSLGMDESSNLLIEKDLA
jgi:hypothetical protein